MKYSNFPNCKVSHLSRIQVAAPHLLTVLLFALSIIATPCYALTPYESRIGGSLSEIKAERFAPTIMASSRGKFRDTSHRFSITLPEHGVLKLDLSRVRSKDWQAFFIGANGEKIEDKSRAALLQGRIYRRTGRTIESFIASASVFESGDDVKIKVNFSLPRRSTGKKSGYELTFINNTGKIARAPYVLLSNKSCGSEGTKPIKSHGAIASSASVASTLSAHVAAPATYRELELSAIGDFQFFTSFGAESANRIASIINAAEAIYERDLDITYQLKSVYIYTTSTQPFTSNNAEILLDNLATGKTGGAPWGSADLYHLFTTRDIFSGSSSSVVGLAYVGVVCDPDFPYGVTERVATSLDHLIFAHEIGHNFGATHDNSTSPTTIMVSVLPPDLEQFSTTTQNEITTYLTSVGYSCLTSVDPGTPTPTPSPTPTVTGTPPTATPSPTPTNPGGGSGSDPDPDSTIAAPSVSAKITKSGIVTMTASLDSGTVDSSCTVLVDLDSTGQFRTGRYQTLNYGALLTRSTTDTGQVKFFAVPTSRSRVARAYFRARHYCEGKLKISRMTSIRIDRVNAKKGLTATKWVKKLATSLGQ